MNDQIYLIGDVHGCYKTLCALIDRLPRGADSKICFVGDLIDRGEESFEVVQLAMQRGYAAAMGNHEYRLLQHKDAFLRGEMPNDPRWFFLNGGAQTFASYAKASRAQKLGKFDILLKEGHIASTNLTNNIKTFTGKDITKEIYKDGKIYGDIKGDNVIFNVNLSSPKSDIKVTGGTYNTATKMLNAPLVCRLEKTDLNVQISGTTDKLKYDVRSQYLENKVKKEIGRFLDKKLGKDDDASGDKQNLKGLLKGLF